MVDLEARSLSHSDHDAALDVRTRSFGPLPSSSLEWWDRLFERTVAADRALGAYVDDTLVAMARIHQYRQLWGGRALPMAGVAGVVVAPEWRGRGVARLLMTATMERAVHLGDVLSVLFPAVATPYRRLGWEMAGAVSRTRLPVEALRRLGASDVPVRRATSADVEHIVDVMRREAASSRASGPLELTRDDVLELIADADNFCYVAADGFLCYAWEGRDLRVERLTSLSPETTRALWALAGSGASAVQGVVTYLPASDPVHWFLDEKAELDVQEDRWMLRVLDAPAAIAGRGFPSGVRVEVPLTLFDPWLPRCAGSFRLVVESGRGVLEPSALEADAVTLGANGLAALYAGTPMTTLRLSGLAVGGDPMADALLDAAFASRCYLLDSF